MSKLHIIECDKNIGQSFRKNISDCVFLNIHTKYFQQYSTDQNSTIIYISSSPVNLNFTEILPKFTGKIDKIISINDTLQISGIDVVNINIKNLYGPSIRNVPDDSSNSIYCDDVVNFVMKIYTLNLTERIYLYSKKNITDIFPDFEFVDTKLAECITNYWYNNQNNIVTGNLPGHRLAGGLGNQLFLIAATLVTSWENNLKMVLCMDTDYKSSHNFDYKNMFEKFFKFEQNLSIINLYKTTTHENLIYNGSVNREGYFQDYRIFQNYRDIINDIFLEILYNVNIPTYFPNYNGKLIGVQVRRGDYINLSWELSVDYYNRAMKKMSEKFDNVTFIAISDDKKWCKENLPGVIIIEEKMKDYEELYFMTKLDGIIISNSTFGWWIAYLGNMTDVIVPYPWFVHEELNGNLYLPEWTKLNR